MIWRTGCVCVGRGGFVLRVLVVVAVLLGTSSVAQARVTDGALQRSLARLVAAPAGPVGAIATLDRNGHLTVLRAGRADAAHRGAPRARDHMRIASARIPGAGDESRNPHCYVSPLQIIGWVRGEQLNFPPGTRYRYSNTDNIVLGVIAQRITGESYRQLLSRLMFGPADLRHTTFPARRIGAAAIRARRGFEPHELIEAPLRSPRSTARRTRARTSRTPASTRIRCIVG